MMRFPQRPDNSAFAADQTIAAARTEIERLFAAALPGFRNDADRIAFPDRVLGKQSDHWKRYKAAFAEVQHGRCGFCEMAAIGSQDGDVEHYRPKGRVSILDPRHQGEEKEHLSNIEGRRPLRTIGTGYWWDAYNWDNYLLSCKICNQRWKSDYFPVAGDPKTRRRPKRELNEHELLLHPFGTEDPARHLSYDLDGVIHGLTPEGVATIQTVGLWRGSLVAKRRPVLQQLHRLIREMTAPTAENALVQSHARTILAFGAPDWPFFPGMTRIYFAQVSQMSWTTLERMVRG